LAKVAKEWAVASAGGFDMTPLLQVVTTTATPDEARRIARQLIERRLAACVQIDGPVESWYRWEGAVETSQEFRCTIKTRAALYPEVESLIRDLHSYEEPEVLASKIREGSASYIQWVLDETSVSREVGDGTPPGN
jgi:periplasmic divalent cation tolerance protein